MTTMTRTVGGVLIALGVLRGEPSPNLTALRLFAPIAGSYERWSRLLSFGQDPHWRGRLVDGLGLDTGASVLDVAAGTGLVSRLLAAQGYRVVALDQSPQMLALAVARGSTGLQATAERLPFPDRTFDGVTFTYLLRYLVDPVATLRELVRVVRPGGVVGMVDFGVPAGPWRPVWRLYTRALLPAVGALVSPGWWRVGRFLGPSIEDFHRCWPPARLHLLWGEAGLVEVRQERPSLGGGLVMWGRRP